MMTNEEIIEVAKGYIEKTSEMQNEIIEIIVPDKSIDIAYSVLFRNELVNDKYTWVFQSIKRA